MVKHKNNFYQFNNQAKFKRVKHNFYVAIKCFKSTNNIRMLKHRRTALKLDIK